MNREIVEAPLLKIRVSLSYYLFHHTLADGVFLLTFSRLQVQTCTTCIISYLSSAAFVLFYNF